MFYSKITTTKSNQTGLSTAYSFIISNSLLDEYNFSEDPVLLSQALRKPLVVCKRTAMRIKTIVLTAYACNLRDAKNGRKNTAGGLLAQRRLANELFNRDCFLLCDS